MAKKEQDFTSYKGLYFCPADSDLSVKQIFYWHALRGIEGYDYPVYYWTKDDQTHRVHLTQLWPTLGDRS